MSKLITFILTIIIIQFLYLRVESKTINIKVDFVDTSVDNVSIFWEQRGGWPPKDMISIGLKTYEYQIQSNTSFLEFNIRYIKSGDTNYVATYEGVRDARVYVDNYQINDLFLVLNAGKDGCNFYVNIESNGSINIGNRTPRFANDRVAPIDAYIKEHSAGPKRPLSTHNYLLAFGVVVHDKEKPHVMSTVEIDYLKLFSKVNDKYELIIADEFNGNGVFDLNLSLGGFYVRKQNWFDKGNEETRKPLTKDVILKNGSIVFYPSDHIEKIFHWWNKEKSIIINQYSDYMVETRIRITGPAFVQIGLDYYSDDDYDSSNMQDDSKHLEAGVSDWANGNSSNWQLLRFYTNILDR